MAYNAASAAEVNKLIQNGYSLENALTQVGITGSDVGNYRYDPRTSTLGQNEGPPNTGNPAIDSALAKLAASAADAFNPTFAGLGQNFAQAQAALNQVSNNVALTIQREQERFLGPPTPQSTTTTTVDSGVVITATTVQTRSAADVEADFLARQAAGALGPPSTGAGSLDNAVSAISNGLLPGVSSLFSGVGQTLSGLISSGGSALNQVALGFSRSLPTFSGPPTRANPVIDPNDLGAGVPPLVQSSSAAPISDPYYGLTPAQIADLGGADPTDPYIRARLGIPQLPGSELLATPGFGTTQTGVPLIDNALRGLSGIIPGPAQLQQAVNSALAAVGQGLTNVVGQVQDVARSLLAGPVANNDPVIQRTEVAVNAAQGNDDRGDPIPPQAQAPTPVPPDEPGTEPTAAPVVFDEDVDTANEPATQVPPPGEPLVENATAEPVNPANDSEAAAADAAANPEEPGGGGNDAPEPLTPENATGYLTFPDEPGTEPTAAPVPFDEDTDPGVGQGGEPFVPEDERTDGPNPPADTAEYGTPPGGEPIPTESPAEIDPNDLGAGVPPRVTDDNARDQEGSSNPEATSEAVTRQKAKDQAVLQARYKEPSTPDWRVRLVLAKDSQYLYNAPSPGVLAPLQKSNGVIFPYTPQISTSYQAQYDTYDLIHSNFRGVFYKNSKVTDLSIRGTFTAQDTEEAQYLLAVIHFFRSVTKMFYGQDKERGTPPPLVYLIGYGDLQFNGHPCLVSQFSYTLPNDVDYIRANGFNNYGRSMFENRAAGSGIAASFGQQARLGILSAFGIGQGAVPKQLNSPTVVANVNNTQRSTYVPTKMEIDINLIPVNTRNQVSKGFSLQEFANGNLIKKGYW